ncbi:MAG: DUF1156 domain-containing protein [Flexilinea sp.]|nr:DUF1156 domain-containing protein [Flexilinea sp.]
MPVCSIPKESERGKTARSGLPSAVHLWWYRNGKLSCIDKLSPGKRPQ